MARDYLSIPGMYPLQCAYYTCLTFKIATTVNVERVFSQGRLVLPHIRNRLSFQSTRALLCVGTWSTLGMISDTDIKAALGAEVRGEEEDLPADWDIIRT